MRLFFWIVLAKMAIFSLVVVPLYVKFVTHYDGVVTFHHADGLLGRGVVDLISSLRLHAGNTNLTILVSLCKKVGSISFQESHFVSISAGLLSSYLFVHTLKQHYPGLSHLALNATYFLYPSLFLFSGLLLKDPFSNLGLALLFHGCSQVTIQRKSKPLSLLS